MTSIRSMGVWLAGLSCVVTMAACSDDPTPAPTPVSTPTPAPPPAGPSFSVSGTVFMSAPSTSTRVAEAEVQLNTGPAYGTAADGTFTIPNVANGTYTLNIRKAGFNSGTVPVTVSGGNVAGVTVNLRPTARIVDEIQDRRAHGNHNQCSNGRSCEQLNISSHNNGESRFFVAWNNKADELDLEWWCNGTRIVRSELNGEGADEIKPAIVAGQTCQLRIINTTNSSFIYTLYLTYPY